MKNCISGNATTAGKDNKGWFYGHFMSKPLLQSNTLELKWDHVPAGKNNGLFEKSHATSVTILVRGKMRFILERIDREEIVLEKEGDFILWDRWTYHYWEALEDCLTITVRWPSMPDNVTAKEFKDEI